MLALFSTRNHSTLQVLGNGQYIARRFPSKGWFVYKLDKEKSGPYETNYTLFLRAYAIREAEYLLNVKEFGYVGSIEQYDEKRLFLQKKMDTMLDKEFATGRDMVAKFYGRKIIEADEDKVVELTRKIIMQMKCLMCPVLKDTANGIFYYFNSDEVWTSAKIDSEFGKKFFKTGDEQIQYDPSLYLGVIQPYPWKEAVKELKEGMTLRDAIRVYLNTEVERKKKSVPSVNYSRMERFVQRIGKPCFERDPDNQNAKTFDRIKVDVFLSRYLHKSWDALRKDVEAHKDEIGAMVLNSIAQAKQFQKYGVPINSLRLTDVTLCRDYSLVYIFEI